MAEDGRQDRMDITIGVILTATVAMIILCYVAIPVISDAIGSLSTTGPLGDLTGILSAVVIMIAVGIIITVIRGFNERAR